MTALWDEEWEKHLLEAARERIRKLVSDAQYQIFDLYVVQGWSAGEVAHTLGVSRGRLYLAKHRVSRLLKQEIERLRQKSGDSCRIVDLWLVTGDLRTHSPALIPDVPNR